MFNLICKKCKKRIDFRDGKGKCPGCGKVFLLEDKKGLSEWRIIRNAAQCKKCGEIIESKGVHDFVMCKCGNCAVDGGKSYLKRSCIDVDGYIELSEYEEVEL